MTTTDPVFDDMDHCGLNADWSVVAYYFGTRGGVDKGANLTDGGVYVLDCEEQAADGSWIFVVVERFDDEGLDEIRDLFKGTAAEARAFAENYVRSN